MLNKSNILPGRGSDHSPSVNIATFRGPAKVRFIQQRPPICKFKCTYGLRIMQILLVTSIVGPMLISLIGRWCGYSLAVLMLHWCEYCSGRQWLRYRGVGRIGAACQYLQSRRTGLRLSRRVWKVLPSGFAPVIVLVRSVILAVKKKQTM
ncbi:hypothetical protein [Serratia symbiotica]|uniref:hypothetical protein n=1 Tax=Serratia symbiotica TaxID=138074 RepID=UPI0030D13E28|nr:hypothetical protein [Serratia symbiotica]